MKLIPIIYICTIDGNLNNIPSETDSWTKITIETW